MSLSLAAALTQQPGARAVGRPAQGLARTSWSASATLHSQTLSGSHRRPHIQKPRPDVLKAQLTTGGSAAAERKKGWSDVCLCRSKRQIPLSACPLVSDQGRDRSLEASPPAGSQAPRAWVPHAQMKLGHGATNQGLCRAPRLGRWSDAGAHLCVRLELTPCCCGQTGVRVGWPQAHRCAPPCRCCCGRPTRCLRS